MLESKHFTTAVMRICGRNVEKQINSRKGFHMRLSTQKSVADVFWDVSGTV